MTATAYDLHHATLRNQGLLPWAPRGFPPSGHVAGLHAWLRQLARHGVTSALGGNVTWAVRSREIALGEARIVLDPEGRPVWAYGLRRCGPQGLFRRVVRIPWRLEEA